MGFVVRAFKASISAKRPSHEEGKSGSGNRDKSDSGAAEDGA